MPKERFYLDGKVQNILDDYRSGHITAEEARSKLHLTYRNYYILTVSRADNA